MATVNWGNVGNATLLLQNELNALANGAMIDSATVGEINNTNGPQLGTLWLHIDSNSNTYTAASYVDILLVPSTTPNGSGGAYPSYTTGSSYKIAASNYRVATIYIDPAAFSAAAVNETFPNVILPSGYFKTLLINQTGFAFPSTNSSTLKFYGTPTQVQ